MLYILILCTFLCHQFTYIFHDGATNFPVFAEKTQQISHFQVGKIIKFIGCKTNNREIKIAK